MPSPPASLLHGVQPLPQVAPEAAPGPQPPGCPREPSPLEANPLQPAGAQRKPLPAVRWPKSRRPAACLPRRAPSRPRDGGHPSCQGPEGHAACFDELRQKATGDGASPLGAKEEEEVEEEKEEEY